MKLTEEQAQSLLWEDTADPDLETIEIGDWVADFKYEHSWVVFTNNADGKQYRFNISRCGSYHTDWDYSWELDVHEVEKVVVEISKWRKVESN